MELQSHGRPNGILKIETVRTKHLRAAPLIYGEKPGVGVENSETAVWLSGGMS